MMAGLLLDTHILVWWTSRQRLLSRVQRSTLQVVQERGESPAISAITLWELALLAKRGRVEPPKPLDIWLAEIERDPGIEVLPLTSRIAFESVDLDSELPRDPVDRIIVATARFHGLQLVTSDKRIRACGGVAVL